MPETITNKDIVAKHAETEEKKSEEKEKDKEETAGKQTEEGIAAKKPETLQHFVVPVWILQGTDAEEQANMRRIEMPVVACVEYNGTTVRKEQIRATAPTNTRAVKAGEELLVALQKEKAAPLGFEPAVAKPPAKKPRR